MKEPAESGKGKLPMRKSGFERRRGITSMILIAPVSSVKLLLRGFGVRDAQRVQSLSQHQGNADGADSADSRGSKRRAARNCRKEEWQNDFAAE
jgi:hypothetical protein